VREKCVWEVGARRLGEASAVSVSWWMVKPNWEVRWAAENVTLLGCHVEAGSCLPEDWKEKGDYI
jgi:hypothetical protein